MRMANPTYSKPNMANLRGPIGRSIIETIKNAPRPDRTRLREEADVCLAAILKSESEEQRRDYGKKNLSDGERDQRNV